MILRKHCSSLRLSFGSLGKMTSGSQTEGRPFVSCYSTRLAISGIRVSLSAFQVAATCTSIIFSTGNLRYSIKFGINMPMVSLYTNGCLQSSGYIGLHSLGSSNIWWLRIHSHSWRASCGQVVAGAVHHKKSDSQSCTIAT